MSGEVPAIVAPWAFLAHVDDGLLVKNLLDNDVLLLHPGKANSNSDGFQPSGLNLLVVGADLPFIMLKVLDLEAEAS